MPERLATLDFDGHRVDRLVPEGVVGAAQVDQVRVVHHRIDDPRSVSAVRKAARWASVSGGTFHWLLFFVNSCTV